MRRKLVVVAIIIALLLLAFEGFSQSCRDLTYAFRETNHGNFHARNRDSVGINVNEGEGTLTIMEWVDCRYSFVQFKIVFRTKSTLDETEWIVKTLDPADVQPDLYAVIHLDIKDHYELTYMRGGTTITFDNDFFNSVKSKKCRHPRASRYATLTELTKL